VSFYRKKAVVVEARQYTGDNATELMTWMREHNRSSYWNVDGLFIYTLEGVIHAALNDYIVKGVHDEFYPVKPDIFAETYELAA
jgi:hypothetical protein